MSGVVFLDATMGMAIHANNSISKPGHSNLDSDGTDSSEESSDSDSSWVLTGDEACNVLGSSMSKVKGIAQPVPEISKALLSQLLRRYPHGKIFNLDENLSNHPEGLITPLTRPDPFQTHFSKMLLRTAVEPHVKESTRRKERRALAQVLPGAQRVIFYPLWDNRGDRWYAGTLAYTTKPTRTISVKDLGYLAAFGTNIMAEIDRVETAKADKAKGDFISSISHELR